MTTHEISLDQLTSNLPEEVVLEDLTASWTRLAQSLGMNPAAGSEQVVLCARDISMLAGGVLDPSWGGGWKWDLRNAAVKTACASIILAALFASGGISSLPPIVWPAVIPLMFEIEKVKIKRSEERVLQILGARSVFFDRTGKSDQLYATLPDWVKEAMTPLEFADFLESLVQAGHAKQHGLIYEVLPNGETVFHLTFG